MTQLVSFTRGIPGSGKTTLARRIADLSGAVRVSLDDLRDMMGDYSDFSKERERLVGELQNKLVLTALAAGRDVIVDATHLHIKYPKKLALLIWEAGYDVRYHIIDCLAEHHSLCRERNRNPGRRSVPEDVMDRMVRSADRASAHWVVEDLTAGLPVIEPYHNTGLRPHAIICDIDGTLADKGSRNPYDPSEYLNDGVIAHTARALYHFDRAFDPPELILLSGRKDDARAVTEEWLHTHGILYDHLLMRAADDDRRDSIVKLDIFNEYVRDVYDVQAVFDDRLRVCQVWHQLGLPLFRVGNPSADF